MPETKVGVINTALSQNCFGQDGPYRPERILKINRRNLVLGGLASALASISAPAWSAQAIVTDIDAYKSALAQFGSTHPATLVDIGAEWCAFCKTIDNKILPDPRIRRAMERVALLKVDVTRMDRSSRDLLNYLRADGPPTLFIVETATGTEYGNTRSVGSFRVNHLLRRLRPFA